MKGTVFHLFRGSMSFPTQNVTIKLRQHKSTPAQQIPQQKKSGNLPARNSNPRPSACKADAQTIRPPALADIPAVCMVCFCFLCFCVNCIGIKSWILNHGALSVYRGVKWLKSSQKSVKMDWFYTMFWTLQGAFVPKAPHATVFNSCVFNHRSTQNKMNWASVLSHNSDHLQQYCAWTMNPFSVHSLISTGVRSQRLLNKV